MVQSAEGWIYMTSLAVLSMISHCTSLETLPLLPSLNKGLRRRRPAVTARSEMAHSPKPALTHRKAARVFQAQHIRQVPPYSHASCILRMRRRHDHSHPQPCTPPRAVSTERRGLPSKACVTHSEYLGVRMTCCECLYNYPTPDRTDLILISMAVWTRTLPT
jgi:hypothetical protein